MAISEQQKEKARKFSTMHRQPGMFILPNAWDVGSAYVFEKQGFAAVATSSAGIAYALGCPDSETVSFDDYLWIVERMSRRLNIPLSVDFERGYGETADEVKDNARKMLLAGVVGFNIEDGQPDGSLAPLEFQLAKIKALTELKAELDIDFVINARSCAYWLNIGNEETKLQTACERGNAFAEAGADCVFVPGAVDENTIRRLVVGIKAPLNIILNGKFNDFAQLRKLGVRRLSIGSSLVRYIFDRIIQQSNALSSGKIKELLNTDFSYTKANAYFK
jgi:2-methylisocitrate lyase-like PEP mutase family enzyme